MAYVIKITNKNNDPNNASLSKLYLDSIAPSLIINPDTPYSNYESDMSLSDGYVLVPLYQRQQFVKIPVSSVLVINTDNSDEAIYYAQCKVNNSVILVDPDPFGGSSGGGTLIEKTITENGTYLASQDDADGYSLVDVNVPNSYVAQDEGKVVSNGTLVSQLTNKSITTNGTAIDTTIYSSVDVDVPNTYTSEDNGKVVTNETLVSQTAYPTTITQNDTYDTTNYNSITVNVASSGPIIVTKCRFEFDDRYFYLGNNTNTIPEYFFQNDTSLESVEVLNNVTEIGKNAFDAYDGYSILTSVTFESNSNLETIGYNAFDSCSSIESITIPRSVRNIKNEAFRYCSSLESVTFESNSNLETIWYSAFEGCASLRSITIPNSVRDIYNKAFRDCISLTSVVFETGSQLQYLSQNIFEACENLASITIPNSVRWIEEGAFSGCSSLTSITIPSSVVEFRSYPFYDSGLTSITFESTQPPSLEDGLGIDTTCTIRVPQGSLSAYTSAENYPDPEDGYIYEEY